MSAVPVQPYFKADARTGSRHLRHIIMRHVPFVNTFNMLLNSR